MVTLFETLDISSERNGRLCYKVIKDFNQIIEQKLSGTDL